MNEVLNDKLRRLAILYIDYSFDGYEKGAAEAEAEARGMYKALMSVCQLWAWEQAKRYVVSTLGTEPATYGFLSSLFRTL